MRFKRLIPQVIRRRLISRRRSRSQNRRFEQGLKKIAELKWQYDRWMFRWKSGHNPESLQQARELLRQIYALIKRLARTSHKLELRTKVKELGIPGAHRFLKQLASCRRR